MMKDEYLKIRKRTRVRSLLTGVGLTLAVHGAALAFVSCTGLKYLWPPEPEMESFLMDFTQEEEPVKIKKRGTQPRSEEIDKTKPVDLIQKSESPYVSESRTNPTPQTANDDFGDVETPAVPEPEEVLDPRATFPGMAKKDTSITAPHAASSSSPEFKAGRTDGNTKSGRTDGTPNAHLKGRNTVGGIAKPSYTVQKEGTVVVRILVDRYGNVKEAQAGADGTTITDKTLFTAARNAAMQTHFNTSADAPELQEGTITYHFKLK